MALSVLASQPGESVAARVMPEFAVSTTPKADRQFVYFSLFILPIIKTIYFRGCAYGPTLVGGARFKVHFVATKEVQNCRRDISRCQLLL